jgi:UDP-3-O-[3-hydroxymyristoyl] N-acetylglucosamine deacetylase
MRYDLNEFQATIAKSAKLSGVGVHSGSNTSISLYPAEANTGIIFKRICENGVVHSLRAVSSQVGSTDFCTLLGDAPDRSVATVEHLMAALYAMGVDNILIEIEGGEVPIMDGSSALFVELLDATGIVPLYERRRYIRVKKTVRAEMGGSWAEFTPHEGTRFEIDIDFASPLIGRQSWKGEVTADSFREELSRARTFGFMKDVEYLWASGHALGSSLENSVVIGDDENVINIEGLRFEDEFVRHKTLDAVGDLALAGAQFIGCYKSYRGGHKLNAMALRKLLAQSDAYEIVETKQNQRNGGYGELIAVSAPVFSPWIA